MNRATKAREVESNGEEKGRAGADVEPAARKGGAAADILEALRRTGDVEAARV